MSPKGEGWLGGGLDVLCKFLNMKLGVSSLLDEDRPIETILNFSLCVTMVPNVLSTDGTDRRFGCYHTSRRHTG